MSVTESSFLGFAYRVADRMAGRVDADMRGEAHLALCRAFRDWREAGSEGPVKLWVFIQVRDAVRDAIRGDARRLARQKPTDPGDLDRVCDREASDRHAAEWVDTLLARLNGDADLARAHLIDGVPGSDLAGRQGMPERSMRRKLESIRNRLASIVRNERGGCDASR